MRLTNWQTRSINVFNVELLMKYLSFKSAKFDVFTFEKNCSLFVLWQLKSKSIQFFFVNDSILKRTLHQKQLACFIDDFIPKTTLNQKQLAFCIDNTILKRTLDQKQLAFFIDDSIFKKTLNQKQLLSSVIQYQKEHNIKSSQLFSSIIVGDLNTLV